jgi:hypothetical protein
MKKRITSLLLILLVISASIFTGSAFANSAMNVELQLDKTEATVGDIIKATVRINNIPNLAGFQINIKYDPEVLQAVDIETKTPFANNTMPAGATLLVNSSYGVLPVASNRTNDGVLNFSKVYMFMEGYKLSGVPETTGILGVIGFKVLKAQRTEIRFENTASMPVAKTGTLLYDWDMNKISTGYSVVQPPVVNPSMQASDPTPLPTSTPASIPVYTPVSTPVYPSVTATPRPVNPTPVVVPGYDQTASVEVDVKSDYDSITKEANSDISSNVINNALAQAQGNVKMVNLNIQKATGATSYIQRLPREVLSRSSVVHWIQITTDLGSLTLPANMLYGSNDGDIRNSSVVSIGIREVNKLNLDSGLRASIGSRPAVEFFLMVEGKQIPWNNPDIQIKASMPYKPSSQEAEGSQYIIAKYIDNNGTILPVPSGKYDAGRVAFTANNFDKFFITYVHKTFNDISSYAWAKMQIEVLASKGVINGLSDTTFAPSADITRADFIILLVKALGLTASVDSNFDDVEPSTYYYQFVGVAKALGVTTGVGNNKFNPREKITRQDMMLLTMNALRISGKISGTGTEAVLEHFTDKADIAPYAKDGVATLVKEGIVMGSGNKINPRGNASRAELAAIIYKIYIK